MQNGSYIRRNNSARLRRRCSAETLEQRALLSGSISSAAPAAAVQHLTVNTFADPAKTTVKQLSLRAALRVVSDDPGNYVITVPAGHYALNSNLGALIVKDAGAARSVVLRGNGAAVIDGLGKVGDFGVTAGTNARFEGLTITGGNVGDNFIGGGVLNLGHLTLTNCTIRNCFAAAGAGVATSDDGSLVVSNSTISSNTAVFQGGGIFTDTDCSLDVVGSIFSDNKVTEPDQFGGAINCVGDTHIASSTFRNNKADNGGAIANGSTLTIAGSSFTGNEGVDGGAIFNSPDQHLAVSGCTFTANKVGATAGGGSFSTGFGAAILNSSGTATIVHSTFVRNDAEGGSGGAIAVTNPGADATIDGCTFDHNHGAFGGGALDSEEEGVLTVRNSSLTNNVSGLFGGGISLGADGTIENCTISGNQALQGGGGISAGSSAVISGCTLTGNSAAEGGGIETGGDTTVVNCTVVGNFTNISEGGLGSGGGIMALERTSILDCTIVGNTGTDGAGVSSGSVQLSGQLILRGSIVAGNHGRSDLFNAGRNPFTDEISTLNGSYDLIGDGTGGLKASGHNLLGTRKNKLDPMLADLSNYGGSTKTMPPLPGSPVIGAGISLATPGGTAILRDQRGVSRGEDPGIGAAQTRGFVMKVVSGNGQTAAPGENSCAAAA